MLVGVSGMPPNISGDSAARLNVVTAGVAREPVSCPRPWGCASIHSRDSR